MLRSMYSGISGMKVNQTKLDVIGNNIANVGTTAFKSSRAEFKDMLYQNAGTATAPTTTKGGTNAKQVGLGAQLSSINKMMGQGNALSTGRSLDVCVDGDGYLIVGKGPAEYGEEGTTGGSGINATNQSISGGDIEISYTRDGNLTLDHEGNLLTADGYRVMGYLLKDTTTAANATIPTSSTSSVKNSVPDGSNDPASIHAEYVNAESKELEIVSNQLQPLMIPDKVWVPVYTPDGAAQATPAGYQAVRSYEIGKDGVITAVLANGNRSALGQIAMSTFKNPEGLNAVGGNLLQKSSNSGTEIVKNGLIKGSATADEKALDNSKGFGDFIQGTLEGSNVDLTEQFTDMITATRSFQASSKMITTGDEILQTITGLMR